jgi:hypothetical protein
MGSTMHFFHCLADGNAEKNDFRIFRLIEVKGTAVSGDSIMTMDTISNLKYLNVAGSLKVRYLKDPYHKSHLKSKVMLLNSAGRGIESTITILEHPCYLDRAGILENPLSVQYAGFWSFEKLANMLPVDFNPPGRKPSINQNKA